MNRSRIASVLLACLLVTAGVAGPMSQPAAATSTTEDCSVLDGFVEFATFGVLTTTNCRDAYVSDAIADYQQTDTEQTKVDIYAQGQQMNQSATNFVAPFGNYLQDTESVAWSKMQVAVAEAYENGSTEAQARYEAEKAIEEYYAVKQRNLNSQFNSHVSTIEYLRNQASMEDNMSASFIHPYHQDPDGDTQTNSITGFDNVSRTLVNGTAVDSRRIQTQGQEFTVSSTATGYAPNQIRINAPTSSYEEMVVLQRPMYGQHWAEIESQNDALVSEAKTFVNATYSDFESGEANASDVIDANTAMFEYASRSGTENESLYNTVGALALMGFDTPNLNQSGTMDVTVDGTTHTGILLARTAPNGSWQANTTYDPSTIDGPVMLATTDGQKLDLTSNFTVEAMRAKDGSSLQSVNTTKYAYKTANASELMAMQKELTALRQEIEEREPSGGGGGSGSGSNQNLLLVLLAGAAGAAILIGKDGGGRRGGR